MICLLHLGIVPLGNHCKPLWWSCNKFLLHNSLKETSAQFVIFHHNIKLKVDDKEIKEKHSIKYLGVFIDCHLNWKYHIHELSKKISRGIGILSKLSHSVNSSTPVQVYYFIIYSHLIYGIIVWAITYHSNIQSLIILQKKKLCVSLHFQIPEHIHHHFSNV